MLGTLATALMLLWLVVPVLLYVVNLRRRKRLHPLALCLSAGLLGYGLLVATAWAADVHLRARMESIDLDGDGGIGGAERTAEAQRAIDDWASDTGRTLVIFTGIPMTGVWFGFCFCVLYTGEWITRNGVRKRSLATASTEGNQTPEARLPPRSPTDD